MEWKECRYRGWERWGFYLASSFRPQKPHLLVSQSHFAGLQTNRFMTIFQFHNLEGIPHMLKHNPNTWFYFYWTLSTSELRESWGHIWFEPLTLPLAKRRRKRASGSRSDETRALKWQPKLPIQSPQCSERTDWDIVIDYSSNQHLTALEVQLGFNIFCIRFQCFPLLSMHKHHFGWGWYHGRNPTKPQTYS